MTRSYGKGFLAYLLYSSYSNIVFLPILVTNMPILVKKIDIAYPLVVQIQLRAIGNIDHSMVMVYKNFLIR